jgi:hypothetical protein
MLDNFYISVFNFYKARLGKRANRVALFYINLLEISIYLAFGAFFLAFANQMNIATITMFKFWVIIGLVTLFIMFKNWMRYNGKKRNILNAKSRSKTPSIYLLWLLPIGCIVLAFVFLQVLA